MSCKFHQESSNCYKNIIYRRIDLEIFRNNVENKVLTLKYGEAKRKRNHQSSWKSDCRL